MIRVLIPLLLFLLPFAVYGMLIALQRAKARRTGQPVDVDQTMNYGVTTVIGFLLAGIGIAIIGTLISKEDATRYEPPILGPDGKLTPGRLVADEPAAPEPPINEGSD